MRKLVFVMLLAMPANAVAQDNLTEEEKKFFRDKAAKEIVGKDWEVAQTAARMLAQNKEGRAILAVEILKLGKERRSDIDNVKTWARWTEYTRVYCYGATFQKDYLKADEVPDDMIPEIVAYFRFTLGETDTRSMKFLAEFGSKASKAIPELERIRDEQPHRAVEAIRTINKIKGK